MANPSKARGTRFETAFSTWWSQNVGPCHRLTLSGSGDKGDVGGIDVRGLEGTVECKNYKFTQKKRENRRPTAGQLSKWFAETEAERRNSCADFALLVIHKPGCADRATNGVVPESFSDNWCWVTVRTLALLGGEREATVDGWVQLTVGEVAELCR